MKTFLAVLATLIFLSTAEAQKPRPLAADVMTGFTKLYKGDDGKFNFDLFKNAGVGVLYRFLIFDGTKQEWHYDFALGAHVAYGYAGGQSEFAILGGVSVLDGWVRLEVGRDLVLDKTVYMFSTSYGFTLGEL